ncbi:uncharacterized protein LOC128021640 isoform X2 [Carassius gibelio]|uniref:uncharacterized protein LOC128021640 isoform X2 n=1 Tax=Carassius gibelio TaxID=101364 RepID=UPI0022783B28|nr:uncharacterized protein LOC128021640 isoform X2 [Carassius gibelio]
MTFLNSEVIAVLFRDAKSVRPGPTGSFQSPPAGAAAQLSVSVVPEEDQLQQQEAGQWAGQTAINQQWEMGGAETCPQRGGAQTCEGASQEHAGEAAREAAASPAGRRSHRLGFVETQCPSISEASQGGRDGCPLVSAALEGRYSSHRGNVWDGNPVVFFIPALPGASEFHHVSADVCVCDAASDYHITQHTQHHLQQQQR